MFYILGFIVKDKLKHVNAALFVRVVYLVTSVGELLSVSAEDKVFFSAVQLLGQWRGHELISVFL